MPQRPTTHRRDFLQGRAAAKALAAAVDRVAPPPDEASLAPAADKSAAPASRAAAERYIVQYARPAMACQFAVLLNAGQYEQGSEAALAALDLVEQLEAQLTVYRETSNVMHINRTAAERDVELDPALYELLVLAQRIATETGGAFDITSAPLIKTWGFHKRLGRVPDEVELQAARALVGFRHVSLDHERRTIRFQRPGVELNFGAIGKGYAVDRAGGALLEAGVRDFLLHGGQSSVLARGSRGDASSGWVIGIGDPLHPERRLAEVTLRDRALATSGATHQFFRHQGKRFGHILDPRTGRPAEGVFSSTVVAPTAAEADAISTAFYALGESSAREFCRMHPEIGMVLVVPGQGGSSVEVVTAGLEEADWRRFA